MSIKGPLTMKDSQGNNIFAGSYLASSQSKTMSREVQCMSIIENIATFQWFDNKRVFKINQSSLLKSKWVRVSGFNERN